MRNTFDYFDEGTYLAHHGIKGQKWGIRRYQNPDGSLTEEGKARYLKDATNALDPKAKRESVKYTASNGRSYTLNTTVGNVRIREHVVDASKSSKELSNLLKEARELNNQEERDWESWIGDENKVRETTKSYIKERNDQQIESLERELESLNKRKHKSDDDNEMIEILKMDIDDHKKLKITDQYADDYLRKNGGSDLYTYLWEHEKTKHPDMSARSDRIFDLSVEYRKESEKYFKGLLGEYGNQRIPTSEYGTTLAQLLSERSGNAFWDLMWGFY